MTPKEKAESIIEKYLLIDDNSDLFCDECGMNLEASKKSAIIAVDAIIKYAKTFGDVTKLDVQYFEEVKAEIQKL